MEIGREEWSHYFKFAMSLGCVKIAENILLNLLDIVMVF